MSLATAYTAAATASARTAEPDSSLLAIVLFATVGMLVSTLATILNPQWFIG